MMEQEVDLERSGHYSATHYSAFCLFVFLILGLAVRVSAGPLDELALDRWAKLSEVERYQLQIAERYHKQQNWKRPWRIREVRHAVRAERRGLLRQLKWALCQVHLRQANTAIKDGFQSVIDYWPESPTRSWPLLHRPHV